LYSPFLKKLKSIIVITQGLKGFFVRQGVSPDKILVASDGVDIKMFDVRCSKSETRKELNLPLDKKIVGYVGRLETMEKEKGIDVLIKAFKILKESLNEVLLCCVGGPQNRIKDYLDLSQKTGLEEKDIVFVDQVKQKLIPKYLKSFDVLAMPFPYSRHYAFYASPLKLFEYMASGRPIVASDLPSIREILNKENAILVEPDNPEALVLGIKEILRSPRLSDKISAKALQDVQQYTWQKRAQRIYEYFRNTEK